MERTCDKCGPLQDGQLCGCDLVRAMLSPEGIAATDRLIKECQVDVEKFVREALSGPIEE